MSHNTQTGTGICSFNKAIPCRIYHKGASTASPYSYTLVHSKSNFSSFEERIRIVGLPQDNRNMSLNDSSFNLLRLRDVHLPSHPLGSNVALAQEMNNSFNLKTLAAAISDGCHFNDIKSYLQCYPLYEVQRSLQSPSQSVNGQLYHPGFYAAKKNCTKTMGLLLEYGMDANSSSIAEIPLLAFAIMWTECSVVDATELVKLLLFQGASPDAIPKDMWGNYLKIPCMTPTNDPIRKTASMVYSALSEDFGTNTESLDPLLST